MKKIRVFCGNKVQCPVFDRSALCVEKLRRGTEDFHWGQSHLVAAKVSHQTGLTNTKIFTFRSPQVERWRAAQAGGRRGDLR
jgi:hypothetical protein